jgi:hypothetical protein
MCVDHSLKRRINFLCTRSVIAQIKRRLQRTFGWVGCTIHSIEVAGTLVPTCQTTRCQNPVTGQADVAVPHIWEVPASNPGRDTAHSDRMCSLPKFPQALQG